MPQGFRCRNILASITVLLVAYQAQSGSPENDPASIKARIATINFEIETYNKDLSCIGDGECEVLEMGSHACGGPSKYLVYSKANPQAAGLKAKAQDFTLAEKQLRAAEFQMVQSCATPTAPEPRCMKNTCVDAAKKKDKN